MTPHSNHNIYPLTGSYIWSFFRRGIRKCAQFVILTSASERVNKLYNYMHVHIYTNSRGLRFWNGHGFHIFGQSNQLNFLISFYRNARFWVICATYGISLGVFNCWQSVLDVILKPHNIDEVCISNERTGICTEHLITYNGTSYTIWQITTATPWIFCPVLQDEAGWLGFYSILAGCVGSVVLAK